MTPHKNIESLLSFETISTNMNSDKIKHLKNLINEEDNPREDESPEDFCNRIPQDNKDRIIKCLYYHDLVKYTDEGETKWTNKANEMFVGDSGSINDIKPRT